MAICGKFDRLDPFMQASNDDASITDEAVATAQHRWWALVKRPSLLNASTVEARKVKATMLAAVIRDTGPDSPAAIFAMSLVRDVVDGGAECI
jgi:hypothetical protein